jgi:hypothetical protein
MTPTRARKKAPIGIGTIIGWMVVPDRRLLFMLSAGSGMQRGAIGATARNS